MAAKIEEAFFRSSTPATFQQHLAMAYGRRTIVAFLLLLTVSALFVAEVHAARKSDGARCELDNECKSGCCVGFRFGICKKKIRGVCA
ncbi:hypothetical protein AAVH_29628 [Aphelenchoides avenae]|nr:hypothetical protein AAVH_29628 [Aphelenchus avenae]